MTRVLLLVVALAAAVPVLAAPGRVPTDAEVNAVASRLRCVVCQSLSVADSPSEMAGQMRDLVRERLSQGESPDAILAYFVSRYGEWVLLTPPARGFALVAWVVPLGALVGGLGGAVLVLHRWTRRRRATPTDRGEPEVDAEALAAVRRELDRRRG
jgi:cytochrome c-type biogenesis protein CcmH